MIYPVDSDIHPLNNPGQADTAYCNMYSRIHEKIQYMESQWTDMTRTYSHYGFARNEHLKKRLQIALTKIRTWLKRNS